MGALKSRPLLEEERFKNMGETDRCDACNRSGHPATYAMSFKGARYDFRSLDELSDDEDASSKYEGSDAGDGELFGTEAALQMFLSECQPDDNTRHNLTFLKVRAGESTDGESP